MLSYLTNEFIKTNFQFNSVGQILFIQKIKELLNNNSGVSYSYKIHNAYSILLELKSVIKDLEYGRTNGFILEEVRKEANEIVKKDLVMPAKQNALYGTVCDEIRKGLSIDKNNQSINATDMDKVHSMYSAICNLENAYEIMDYLNDTVDMLKSAIQSDECEKIIDLTECLVSSIIITKRSISSVYTNVGYFFERSGKAFDDCWNQWVGNLLRIDAKYKCYFKIEDKYKEITLKNGTAYTLVVQTDLFVVQQATKVLLSIFPYVILMIFLLTLFCAWFYTRYITRPIVQLSGISKQMAELDFSGQCTVVREDELGCLAQNLNSLSVSLSTALNDLQTANQQLKTDMEKEQALEQQRVEFFSAASHELKTPLTILKGHLSGMLNGISGYENHTEYMERSLAVVDRMENLVKELLYVSKTEGTQKSAYKVVDFAEVFRVQLATVSDLSEEKKQHLEVNIPDRLYCEVEQVQMERAIQNILVNAIRYSPSNESIHITLSEIHGTIRGEIENTGVHVPDDALPHLFEAFYRADASRNRNTGGTGLGLYIVRKIMEMHHAKYGITNTRNGVMFWFELPCKQPIDNSI